MLYKLHRFHETKIIYYRTGDSPDAQAEEIFEKERHNKRKKMTLTDVSKELSHHSSPLVSADAVITNPDDE